MSFQEQDGKMTEVQRQRLEEWKRQEFETWLDDYMENDPCFKAQMAALDMADQYEVDELTYMLAADVAVKAYNDVSEEEWFLTISENNYVRLQVTRGKIPLEDLDLYINRAVLTLKELEIWPW